MPRFGCISFFFWGGGRGGLMPLFRWGWALCLFLDVFIFFGQGVGFMPLFRCIYFSIYFFFKVWLYASFKMYSFTFLYIFFLKVSFF